MVEEGPEPPCTHVRAEERKGKHVHKVGIGVSSMHKLLTLALAALLVAVCGVLLARESHKDWSRALTEGLALFIGAIAAFAFLY